MTIAPRDSRFQGRQAAARGPEAASGRAHRGRGVGASFGRRPAARAHPAAATGRAGFASYLRALSKEVETRVFGRR